MKKPEILLTPRRPALLSGMDNTLDVLVRVQAPDIPAEGLGKRPRLNLAIVIDRSGSMAGQPLTEAKRCASFLVDRLGPRDTACLVAYDSTVDVLVPCCSLEDPERFRRAIASIGDRGCTNLHGGWLAGAEQVAPHVDAASVTRVILLSDGQANEGLTEPDRIYAQCSSLAEAGVTTSTYGLGHHFNEELMIGMARHGRGNSYYGQTAEDLMDPFQEEFSLLQALYARQLCLGFTVPQGVSARVMNAYPVAGNGASRLPDLAYGGEAWALVRLTIPKTLTGSGDGATLDDLLGVSLDYQDLDGIGHTASSKGLTLPSLHAQPFAAVTEDELVARRALELEAADLQDQAQEAARRGDWKKVRRLLEEVRSKAGDNEWLTSVVTRLEDLAAREDDLMLAKEMRYQSAFLRTRLAPKAESLSMDRCFEEPMYLRRKAERGKRQ